MELMIDIVGVAEADVLEKIGAGPGVEVVHSTGVIGGDPIITAVVHDVFHNLPAIISSLAAVLVAWQKRDALRRVVLKKGPKTTTLDIRGMSGEDLKQVLESRITEFNDDKAD
ncbi:hypothetical protein [Paraburkholderia ferrariae]|uniref:Uncharacterized protein n=1 Tax=Paraburkholderia ferrariae TaxID=386056 RepID=A0ABU9RYS9_9BURK